MMPGLSIHSPPLREPLKTCLPASKDKNDLSPHIAKFVLSLGATINMDGTTAHLESEDRQGKPGL